MYLVICIHLAVCTFKEDHPYSLICWRSLTAASKCLENNEKMFLLFYMQDPIHTESETEMNEWIHSLAGNMRMNHDYVYLKRVFYVCINIFIFIYSSNYLIAIMWRSLDHRLTLHPDKSVCSYMYIVCSRSIFSVLTDLVPYWVVTDFPDDISIYKKEVIVGFIFVYNMWTRCQHFFL